jgi:hypothetical protein
LLLSGLHMWRSVKGLGLVTLALPLFAACGGVVEGGSHDPGEGTSKSTPTASAPDQSRNNADADTELGDCTLGPTENLASDQACAWVADKRCYQTREMACNCACPRSHDSQCASGWDSGPTGHVWVACD